MDSTYAAQYRTLYECHWWWRAREAAILREIDRLLNPGEGRAILDVGCGDGLLFDRLKAYGRVEGVEIDPLTVAADSRWRPQIHFGPFDESYQPGRSFDLILMLDVLEHLKDPAAALRRVRSLLKPQGMLLATVPAFNLLWTGHDDLNRHVTRYTRRSFAELAEAAGVRIHSLRYLFHWTFLAKLAVRLKEAMLGARPAPPRVPPRFVNEALALATRCEQATLGRLPVPFGSSLLAIVGP
jgi:SAM-dependent methyltransferase